MSNATTYQITILSYCIFNVMFFSYQALSSWLWSLGKIYCHVGPELLRTSHLAEIII